MSAGIDVVLEEMTAAAERDCEVPIARTLAGFLTDREPGVGDKVRALVDELHRRFRLAPDPAGREALASPLATDEPVDADGACLFVATLAMSVGIRCRFVAARYGQSWTCWLAYEDGEDRWVTVDPLRRRPERGPDEGVLGRVAGRVR